MVKKRQKDISGIEQKIISLYAKGMTTRQISDTIEEIYGFEVSDGMVSDITDRLLPQIEDWQNRPLDEVYPIVFIDAVHFSVRDNGQIRKLAAYVILAVSLRRNWGSGDHVPRQAGLSRHSQSASIPLRSISAD